MRELTAGSREVKLTEFWERRLRLQRGLGPAPDAFFVEGGPLYICYLDESGVIERGAGTSHFVLLGLAVPAETWKQKDVEISTIKLKHRLGTAEIHTGWMLRRYQEQEQLTGFEQMSETNRRLAVTQARAVALNAAAARGAKPARDLVKNHRKTSAYIHLTYPERVDAIRAVADAIGAWSDCALFSDAQRKDAHDARNQVNDIFDFAFEQVVTRFNTFLKRGGCNDFGMVVQDRNETASDRLTWLMRRFHERGTSFSEISRIVETPLFVDSALTSMVQLADICSYATRRFIENGEADLFDRIYPRFDRAGGKLVGLRHYTGKAQCACRICVDHGR